MAAKRHKMRRGSVVHLWASLCCMSFVVLCGADTRYVSLTGGHVSPYTNWVDAATNIQDAIDVSLIGDTVLVADGTYYPTSTITIVSAISLESVNGPSNATINGQAAGDCVHLFGAGASLSGFTVVSGSTRVVQASFGTVSNCALYGVARTEDSRIDDCRMFQNDGGEATRSVFTNCILGPNGAMMINQVEMDACIFDSYSLHGSGSATSMIRNSQFGGGSVYGDAMEGALWLDNIVVTGAFYAERAQFTNSFSGPGWVTARNCSFAGCTDLVTSLWLEGDRSSFDSCVIDDGWFTASGSTDIEFRDCTFRGDVACNGGGNPMEEPSHWAFHNTDVQGTLDLSSHAEEGMLAAFSGTLLNSALDALGTLLARESLFTNCTVGASPWNTRFEIHVDTARIEDSRFDNCSVSQDSWGEASRSFFTNCIFNSNWDLSLHQVEIDSCIIDSCSFYGFGSATSTIRNSQFGGGSIYGGPDMDSGLWLDNIVVTGEFYAEHAQFINSLSGPGWVTARNCSFAGCTNLSLTWLSFQGDRSALDSCVIDGVQLTASGPGPADIGFRNCTFQGEVACQGDPMEPSSWAFHDTDVQGTLDFTGPGGGGVRATFSGTLFSSTPYYAPGTLRARECVFSSCTITNIGWLQVSSGTLTNCLIVDSSGTGLDCRDSIVRNCLIAGNGGGGLHCASSFVQNCTIVANIDHGGGAGGVVADEYSILENCIIWGNSTGLGESNWQYSGSATVITHTCTSPLPPGVGNTTNDPLFLDLNARDCRLHWQSPCIDAGGAPWMWMQESLDLGGNRRLFNIVDMGAYETMFSAEVRVFLQGPYNTNVHAMTAATEGPNPLPLSSPYALDIETVDEMPANATDWVLVQLMDTNGLQVGASETGLLRSDGRVVDEDGVSGIPLEATPGSYYIAVKHRNHLAAISAQPVAYTNLLSAYDFRTGWERYYGGTNAAVELEPGVWGMIAGDADGDGKITWVDRAVVSNQVGKTGYLSGDVNLDGVVTAEE